MLRGVARWSLDRPWLVVLSCALLMVAGGLYIRDIKVAFLPDIAPARAVLHTEAPGLVAAQVEELVTRRIESALAGTAGVARVHSESSQGLSTVTLTFSEGVDPLVVRQALIEKLVNLAGVFPAGVAAPRLSPLGATEADGPRIGFTSDTLKPMALRDLVEWTVRPRLLAAPGVARVALDGGETRRIEVRARPGDLSDSDLGFLDILAAVRRATGVAGAGFIDTANQRVVIEPHGQALTPEDVGAGQIQTPGAAPVRISDVADVFEAAAPRFGDALIDGKPGVVASIAAAHGANRLDVETAVTAAMAALRPALASAGVGVRTDLDGSGGFAIRAVRGVGLDLLAGVALVSIALFAFLRGARVALVSLVAIPVSLIIALAMIKACGWTINAMTLGGLAVALGVVIDDAAIDVENIAARLREANQRHATRDDAIVAASVEVRGSVVHATLVIVLAALPLLLLKGAAGALLRPMAGAMIAASLASLLVAAVVTPAMARLTLGHVRPRASRPGGRLTASYEQGLVRLGRRPGVVVVASLVAVALALLALMFVRPVLLPGFHDDHLSVQISAPTSTSLEVMRAYGVGIAGDLRRLPGVTAVVERGGRDPTGDEAAGVERATIDVELAAGLDVAAQEAVATRVRQALLLYPGLNPIVSSGFDAQHEVAGASAPVTVTVYGPDLDALDEAASRIAASLKSLAGGRTAHVDDGARAPVVRVDINFRSLAIYGLSAADVLDTVQAAFAGTAVSQVYVGNRAIDLAVTAQDSLRQDPEAVGDLLLRSSSGFSVPLKSVANIYLTEGRAMIAHDNGLRRQTVVVDPPASQVLRFTAEARRLIASHLSLPTGVFLEIADPTDGAARLGQDLAVKYAFCAFAIFALLAVAFDVRSALLITASALFALIGGVVAVMAMKGEPSVGAMAGFVALLGLSMRSAILLLTRLEDLVVVGHAAWSFDTVIQATRERLRPLVMSAILVAAGLAPFAARAGAAGHEILGPMAIVIILGLLVSTLASLFLTPVLIYRFWRPGLARLARRHRAVG